MNLIIKITSIVAIATVLFTSCNPSNKEKHTAVNATQSEIGNNTNADFQKGDHLTSNLVCMVNDEYMGKQQLEVPFEGKMYYGCCKMCQERIPIEESVRYATDPQTLEKVDKATAYIVLIGDNGEVAYFKDQSTFEEFKNNVVDQ